MRLSQATDYAFRAVLHLSSLPRGQVVEAKTIAEAQQIPMRFLLKILRLLTRAGLTESYQGINGGYALARPPEEITMLDVIEAVEGPIKVNRCLIAPEECSRRAAPHCPVHQTLASIQQAIAAEFKRRNFADLCTGLRRMQ
ncbi:MAG: Rrf2 family transcriptional regulator [Firmicutes bacterium]|nr:Rrf2 family transcriptional regulator [Bacillota bacterium]